MAKPHSQGLVVELLETRSLLNGALTPVAGHAEPGPDFAHSPATVSPEHQTAPTIDYGEHQAHDSAPTVQAMPVDHATSPYEAGGRDLAAPTDLARWNTVPVDKAQIVSYMPVHEAPSSNSQILAEHSAPTPVSFPGSNPRIVKSDPYHDPVVGDVRAQGDWRPSRSDSSENAGSLHTPNIVANSAPSTPQIVLPVAHGQAVTPGGQASSYDPPALDRVIVAPVVQPEAVTLEIVIEPTHPIADVHIEPYADSKSQEPAPVTLDRAAERSRVAIVAPLPKETTNLSPPAHEALAVTSAGLAAAPVQVNRPDRLTAGPPLIAATATANAFGAYGSQAVALEAYDTHYAEASVASEAADVQTPLTAATPLFRPSVVNDSWTPATLVTNALNVDLSSLEGSVRDFFDQVERMGRQLSETQVNMLFSSSVVVAAASVTLELVRRRMRPVAPIVSLQHTGTIPYSDF